MNSNSNREILAIEDLAVEFLTPTGYLRAVDGVSLTLKEREVLGIVGESGCGKSVSMLSILQLLPPKRSRVSGKIMFKGENLLEKTSEEMQEIRGASISMIFQEPMTSLNPVFTIGSQIEEMFEIHTNLSLADRKSKSKELLHKVGIPQVDKIYDYYPHQLSGGMRQRIMIAIAIACNPDILIADEPTTALDVTIQAQILDTFHDMGKMLNMSMLFVTHDLGVINEVADRVVVLYAGKVVEETTVDALFTKPLHFYTKGLLASRPALLEKGDELICIEGAVPPLGEVRAGCTFAPRCPEAKAICQNENPPFLELEKDHFARCWFYTEEYK